MWWKTTERAAPRRQSPIFDHCVDTVSLYWRAPCSVWPVVLLKSIPISSFGQFLLEKYFLNSPKIQQIFGLLLKEKCVAKNFQKSPNLVALTMLPHTVSFLWFGHGPCRTTWEHLLNILRLLLLLLSSVTRFGEISPLWRNITRLWQFFDSLFLFWQNVKPTLANLLHY